jgi:hypothetical protein
MTRTRVSSGQAAKQPTAPTPGASLRSMPRLCRSLPILRASISMGCAVNGAPTWAAKRLPISHAGC